jgi:spore maturation protein CgeB
LLRFFPGRLFLEEAGIPYVSLWTDNTIKHQFLLKKIKTTLHRAMFVPDTSVIKQLKKLGWENVFYLPPWHIDKNIFKPVKPRLDLAYDISFAATINPYNAERLKWREGWNSRMHLAADKIIRKCHARKDYVDVFNALEGDWDVGSLEFNKLSHALYFEQKALAREQIIHSLGEEREFHIVGMGTAITNRRNVIMHEGRDWNDLSPLFCSSKINLNLTPWPKSCHHRVFQIAASRAFVLTDWREDSLQLFEPNIEVVYFKSMNELPGLIDRYINSPEERTKIATAGYRRFLSEHTVTHRMAELSTKLYELL